MKNRKATEAFIIEHIEALTPGSNNASIYRDMFKNMSDEDFETYMSGLETGKIHLSIIEPNFDDSVTVENNLQLAEKLGHDFFEHIWIEDDDGITYLTPIKYMVIDLPLKRMSQLLTKKVSIPTDTKTVDRLTAQFAGSPKGAKISYPELQIAAAMDLDSSMEELMKYRGGDQRGKVAYENMLSKIGKANLDALRKHSSGVQSTKALKTLLTAAHLQSTL